ncbi:MAG: UDP-N-acetylmuramate dehydrogenase [Chloroflexota bacterium]
MNIERDRSLAAYTSLRVGGGAEYGLRARSSDEVAEGLAWARAERIGARVLGGGSNLLVADAGVDALVVRCEFTEWTVEDTDSGAVVAADAGVTLANLARRLAKQGYSGIEWAANVPGTVGGATVNNAGAFGGDLGSCLVSADVVSADGARFSLAPEQLQYAYRSSRLKERALGDVAVVRVRLRLSRSTPDEADGRVKEFNAQRMRSQPRIASAGSVFANPAGTYAGKLIEEAGLKGARCGGAEISQQHANFIVVPGRATAKDVYTLMRTAQDAVYGRTGIWLQPEIELLGRWTDAEHAALQCPSGVPDDSVRERIGAGRA